MSEQVSRESELANFQARKSADGEIEVTKQRIKSLRNDISGTQALFQGRRRQFITGRNRRAGALYSRDVVSVDKQRKDLQVTGSLLPLFPICEKIESDFVKLRSLSQNYSYSILQINQNFKTRVIDELSQSQDSLVRPAPTSKTSTSIFVVK